METFYEAMNLSVEAYESFCAPPPREIAGDIAFYAAAAGRFGAPVLELACGTGRVARGLAQAGFDVHGLDASEAMLDMARRLAGETDAAPAGSLCFATGRLEDFTLGRAFPLIVVPYRSFLMLLDADAQMACLRRIAAHLAPEGAAILHIFDPRLAFLTGHKEPPDDDRDGRSALTGKRVHKALIKRDVDRFAQVIREVWRHEEFDDSGGPGRRQDLELAVRWIYRYEFAHLIARCGLAIEEEFSDFAGAPPAYGGERVIVLKRT
jgi:2-polyprenyl-3-methyl-5-hydroxy-6-metoxy-1,4-benzoquinol methylase